MANQRKNVLIIYTGGTIGMIKREQDGSYIPFDFNLIKSEFPELDKLGCSVEFENFDPPLDSSNIGPPIWIKIANTIGVNYDKYDGFVVLHGSDTMAYTGSALSFMLEGLGKPVIMTGAQLPINEIRTDAKENLVTALQIASHPDCPIREVGIYFEYKLYRANRTQKVHADVFSAFNSLNFPPLVEAGVHLYFRHPTPVDAWQDKVFKVQPKLDTRVAHARFILNITQCMGGSVEMGRYETSAMLLSAGVLPGADLTFEAALTKMMYLFGKYDDLETVKRLLVRNIRGEMKAERAYTD